MEKTIKIKHVNGGIEMRCKDTKQVVFITETLLTIDGLPEKPKRFTNKGRLTEKAKNYIHYKPVEIEVIRKMVN